AELESAGPLAKFSPQHRFRQRHLAPQFASAPDRISGAGDHRAGPPPLLRLVPLPRPGWRFSNAHRVATPAPLPRLPPPGGAPRVPLHHASHGPPPRSGEDHAKSPSISPAVALALPTTPGMPAPGWVPAPTR